MKPTATPDFVRPPRDPDASIWRYTDYAKFAATLDMGALFFPRASTLGDPFEGSFPRPQQKIRIESLKGLPEERMAALLHTRSGFYKWQRNWMLVSCWHLNDQESAAMWTLYARASYAVAIRTTYAKLRAALPEDVVIGMVNYVDYSVLSFDEGNILAPFFHKRRSYEHERELRAVIWDHSWSTNPGQPLNFEVPPPDNGRWVPVDLNQLVQAVNVAPSSESWYRDLVANTAQRFGLTAPVARSDLDDAPFF